MVAEKTAAGWQFVYLGCDIDATQQGREMGIAAGNTMSYDRHCTAEAVSGMNTAVSGYAAEGSAASGKFLSEDACEQTRIYGEPKATCFRVLNPDALGTNCAKAYSY